MKFQNEINNKKLHKNISRRFLSENYDEMADDILNPYRGWYRIVYYMLGSDLKLYIDDYNRQRESRIELAIINISAFKEQEITEAALKQLREIFDNYRKNSVGIIVRAVYDHEGKASEKEPFYFSMVEKHIEQIGEIVSEYSDIIFVYQGLLIGKWGEMHSSRFIQKDKIKTLSDILKKATQNKVFTAVRTPALWRSIHNEEIYESQLSGIKIGLFDDAIFGSDTHMGTFGMASRESTGWDNAWTASEELDFEDRLCSFTPFGGELVFPENKKLPSEEEILKKLRCMHVSYINKYYDTAILDAFKKQTFSGAGIWNGRNLYEYIGAHLGYRYVIRNAYVSDILFSKRTKKLHIIIENTGFAGIYRKTSVYAEWSELGGTMNRECVLDDISKFNDQNEIEIVYPANNICGNIYVLMEISDTKEIVRFANKSDSLGRVLIGAIAAR